MAGTAKQLPQAGIEYPLNEKRDPVLIRKLLIDFSGTDFDSGRSLTRRKRRNRKVSSNRDCDCD